MRPYVAPSVLIVALAAACSGGAFKGASGKKDGGGTVTDDGGAGDAGTEAGGDTSGGDEGGEGGTAGKGGSTQTGGDDGEPETYRAIPPTETDGAYLTCETYDSGAGSATEPGKLGCNVFKVDQSKLDLTGAKTVWAIEDGDGTAVPIVPATVPAGLDYHGAFEVSHRLLANAGYKVTLTINDAATVEPTTLEHIYEGQKDICGVVMAPDGKVARACGRLLDGGLNSRHSLYVTHLGLTPPKTSDFAVRLLTLDVDTGICSTLLRTSTLSFDGGDADGVVLEAATASPLGATRFCFEVTIKTTPPVIITFK